MIPRVTLDDLFPNAQQDDEPFECINKLLQEPLPCLSCGRPTVWVDLNAEAPICSMVCSDAFYAGYEYARAYEPGVGLRMNPFAELAKQALEEDARGETTPIEELMNEQTWQERLAELMTFTPTRLTTVVEQVGEEVLYSACLEIATDLNDWELVAGESADTLGGVIDSLLDAYEEWVDA